MSAKQATEKPVFWGFLAVGFIALAGGIVMVFVVARDYKAEQGAPSDMGLVFTQVYSNQNLLKNERGKFTPALSELGVEQDKCRRYECLLTLAPDAMSYKFKMTKEGRTWYIESKSPVPKEEKQ